jgi:hypothetical protein
MHGLKSNPVPALRRLNIYRLSIKRETGRFMAAIEYGRIVIISSGSGSLAEGPPPEGLSGSGNRSKGKKLYFSRE